MLKDLLRMKEIYSKALLITASIITHYPMELDLKIHDEKKSRNKAEKKIDDAFTKWKVLVADIQGNMKLGFYGKARLCKRIQSNLLGHGYSTDATVYIIEKLLSLLTRKELSASGKPDYAEAYYNLGNLLLSQGRKQEALDSYNQALAIKSDYPVVRKKIRECS